jgi:FdhD protein
MAEPAIINIDYLDYDGQVATPVRRPVIAETPWVIYVDRHELLTTMCTPARLHCLALGFLLNEGIIHSLDDVWQLRVFLAENRVYTYFPAAGLNGELRMQTCEESIGSIDVRLKRPALPRGAKRILTSGCGGGLTFDDLAGHRDPLQSSLTLRASQLVALMRVMNGEASLYRQSRGVHTSALFDPASGTLLAFGEDVGRHNTLDKIRGECMLAGIRTAGRVLISSGRISTEMIGKAYKMGVPVVVSRTSPTATSVRLARLWGLTLVGYLRADRMRVYAGAERICFDQATTRSRPEAALAEQQDD